MRKQQPSLPIAPHKYELASIPNSDERGFFCIHCGCRQNLAPLSCSGHKPMEAL